MSSFFAKRTKGFFKSESRIIETSYSSNPVTIPSDFLRNDVSDSTTPSLHRIDFSTSALPNYHPSLALIIDNILSPSECRTLLSLAEESAASEAASGGWRPALVNAGGNYEVHDPDYRNSERIIWDDTDMVARVWARCAGVDGVMDAVEEWGVARDRAESESVLGPRPLERGEVWKFTRLNERMRFLKYGRGMFFAAHCDGSYVNPNAPPEKPERSLLTLQLYLNNDDSDIGDDKNANSNSSTILGGATSFLDWRSQDDTKRIDVKPRTGRVLIFQQRGLRHEGEEVLRGVKYTMRTDLMYEGVECSR